MAEDRGGDAGGRKPWRFSRSDASDVSGTLRSHPPRPVASGSAADRRDLGCLFQPARAGDRAARLAELEFENTCLREIVIDLLLAKAALVESLPASDPVGTTARAR